MWEWPGQLCRNLRTRTILSEVCVAQETILEAILTSREAELEVSWHSKEKALLSYER